NLGEGPDLVHVDADGVGGEGEIDGLDLEADLDRAVTVVEWGRDRVEHLADSTLLVVLDRPDRVEDPEDPDEPRTLHLLPSGPRWDEQAVAHLEAVLAPVGAPARPGSPRPPPAPPAEANRAGCRGFAPPGRRAPPGAAAAPAVPAGTSRRWRTSRPCSPRSPPPPAPTPLDPPPPDPPRRTADAAGDRHLRGGEHRRRPRRPHRARPRDPAGPLRRALPPPR